MGFVEKLRDMCLQEWQSFGKQEYDVSGQEIRQGKKEFEQGEYERIGQYWSFLGYSKIDGRDRDWPWSAAFISYMEHLAGAGKAFLYSIRHSDYLNKAIEDRNNAQALYRGYRINEVSVKVGDILGYARAGANVDYDTAVALGRYTSHSDIVVDITESAVSVIGGNVGDSVTKRHYGLEAGKISETVRPWVCHMSVNEGALS